MKAGGDLKNFNPSSIHVTPFDHVVHMLFRGAIKFSVKEVFMKVPSRIQTYREILPSFSHLPELVIMRWGTWIEIYLFYSKHFLEIKVKIN